jgi:ATP-dependent Lon protease
MSVAAVDEALATKDRLVLLCAQTDESEDEPAADGIHRFGTVGMIMRMRKLSDGRIKVLVQGLMRARLTGFVQKAPCFTVNVERVEEAVPAPSPEIEALMRSIKDDLGKFSQAGKLQSPELMLVLSGVEEPGRLADLVASNVTMKVTVGQGLLEELDAVERLRKVGTILRQEVEIIEVQETIQSRAKEEMSKAQREYFLREQLRQIQSELGGGSKGDLDQLRGQVETARMPAEARAEADRQLRRLEQANADSVEAGVLRTYLEWLVEVPWRTATDDALDLDLARQILEEEHYGLEDVKDRILEHLGVLKLTRERGRDERGPIICFVGPPGVGKTSLGRSIARSLGRRFVRMSLGGVRDEA